MLEWTPKNGKTKWSYSLEIRIDSVCMLVGNERERERERESDGEKYLFTVDI